jgi:hypothetical protein
MILSNMLERCAITGLTASAEALFPANDYGAPDYRDTDLVARTVAYWRVLPPRQRRLIVMLFTTIELSAPLLVFGFRRFSRLTVARRELAVRRFRNSRSFPLRVLGDALKATLTFLYMAHPAALAYIGATRSHPEVALPGTLATESAP